MPTTSQLLERLTRAVKEDAAIRRVRRLQPTGGRGDKIFPPTYPGDGREAAPRHVYERRRIDGRDVLCVLVDSVQSQANRLEEGLKIAREDNQLRFPTIAVDFAKTDVPDLGRISTLEAPHRVFDAIIRDSVLKGTRFKETAEGKRLIAATTQNALALYEFSPTSLVFGAWNSTGQGGGLGAKFPRVLVSEIIGVGVAEEPIPGGEGTRPSGLRTGSRVDPLGIRASVRVFKQKNGEWSLDAPKGRDKGVKEVKPSEVNHSNITPSVVPLGVSVDRLEHSFVLSLAALRRLRFGEKVDAVANVLGRTALAALGLAAAASQDRAGYFLRSRCDLVPEEGSSHGFEWVLADGRAEKFEVDFAGAATLCESAAAAATKAGLQWRDTDLILQPQDQLVELVKRSREQALAGAEAEGDDE